MTIKIIYHKNCLDGLAAAAALGLYADYCEHVVLYEATQYGDPVVTSDLAGVDFVWIADFSYPPEKLLEIASYVKQVVVMDHHESAVRSIVPPFFDSLIRRVDTDSTGKIHLILDMNRSGAKIAFDFVQERTGTIFTDTYRRLVAHVEDRDLWRFKIEHTREVTRALGQYISMKPFEFKNYVEAVGIDALIHDGAVLLVDDKEKIGALVKGAFKVDAFGYSGVPCVNVPAWLASETLNILADESKHGFAIGFTVRELNKVTVSLRASKHGPNVALLAEKFGGGGHAKAAGFVVDQLDRCVRAV